MRALAAAGLSLVLCNVAHGASFELRSAVVIDRPAANVWEVASDFEMIPPRNWHPMIAEIWAQGSDRAAAERYVILKTGGYMREELQSLDNASLALTVRTSDVGVSAPQIANHVYTLKVRALTPETSEVEWVGRFDAADSQVRARMEEFYKTGLEGLREACRR